MFTSRSGQPLEKTTLDSKRVNVGKEQCAQIASAQERFFACDPNEIDGYIIVVVHKAKNGDSAKNICLEMAGFRNDRADMVEMVIDKFLESEGQNG